MREPRPTPSSPAGTNVQTAARFEELLNKVQEYRPKEDLCLLRRAYEFSAEQHQQQKRASGEIFLSHPLEVAHLLAEMRLDVTTLCVGLLHDVVEDTRVDLATIGQQFGAPAARLVEGVTKLNRLSLSSSEVRQAENLRNMLLAMVADVRVILIKLADRLHNMRTLRFLPPEKGERVARETLDIYAPIAHRLGMGNMRMELEELAFGALEPEKQAAIREQLESKQRLNERFLADVQAVIDKALNTNGLAATVQGRIKRPYSIHRKMVRQGVTLGRMYDLLAIRVITDSIRNCYSALGVIHQLWPPVPGRFKDYIAMPRPNLYQSLHTSVIHPTGQPFEIQIRTQEMHRLAEQGIAAHWRYKEDEAPTPEIQKRIAWLRHLIDWTQEMQDPSEFLSTLKVDLYAEEVYTFTPRGKVIVLPRGATPIDFAYAIHTEVGHTCVGAKVNGRIVSLGYPLQNGDVVEILTQAGHKPSRDWLSLVQTSRARHKIQYWIRSQQRTQAVELGRRLLEKESRRHKLKLSKVPDEEWKRVAREYGSEHKEELLARVGFGKFSPRAVLTRLSRQPLPERRPAAGRPAGRVRRTVARMFRLREKGLPLNDTELMMYRARCCSPISGEPVVGYITRGRGIAVHAESCPNVQNLLYNLERRVSVDWMDTADDSYPVRLAIHISDRPGLLTQVTGAITAHQCNIRTAEARTDPTQGTGVIDLVFDAKDAKQLNRILAAIGKVPGVREVQRVFRV